MKEKKQFSDKFNKEVELYQSMFKEEDRGIVYDVALHFAYFTREQIMEDAIDGRIMAIGQNVIVKEEDEDSLRRYLSRFEDGEEVKIVVLSSEN